MFENELQLAKNRISARYDSIYCALLTIRFP